MSRRIPALWYQLMGTPGCPYTSTREHLFDPKQDRRATNMRTVRPMSQPTTFSRL